MAPEAVHPLASGAAGIDLFTAAPDGIVIVDEGGLITTANELAGEMFGYPTAELVGQPIEVLLPERFREGHVNHRKSYSAHPTRRPMGLTLALFGLRSSGEEFPVDISLNYEHGRDGRLRVIAFVRDATARKSMEEELRTTEQNFRLLVDGIGDHALLMLDPAGSVVTWNPGAQRIKGWSADEIVGRHFSMFYLPEDVASGQPERDLERAATEGRVQSEGWRVRAGGQRFWAETTLSAVRDPSGTLRGFATVTRDRTEQHHTRARLESIGALNRAVLEQRPEDDLLALVVTRARAMVDASLAVAWSPTAAGDGLAVSYAAGDGASALLGTAAPDDSIVTSSARSLRVELAADLRADARVPRALVDAGLESGLFVPLHAAGETFGVLGVMTTRGREPLQAHDADLLQAFGGHAAASFAHARARRDAEQLHLVADRERIARDLHDTVIQRLFAVGLSLEATSRRPGPEVQERIHQAVSDIDDTIRSIRSSIFGLEARAEQHAKLRGRVLDVVAQATTALGFEPSVRFDGPVDTLADNETTDNVVSVLREVLTNVARHAQASGANIRISAAADELVLVVDDNGNGADTFEREGGHGVANLRERARMLGGSASVELKAPRGTRVEWRVPTRS